MSKEINRNGSITLRIPKYSDKTGTVDWNTKEIGNPSNCLDNAKNQFYIQKTIGLLLYNNAQSTIQSIEKKENPSMEDLHKLNELKYFLSCYISDTEYQEMVDTRRKLFEDALEYRRKLTADESIIDKKAWEIQTQRIEKYYSAACYCTEHVMIKFHDFNEARTIEPLSFMIAFSMFPALYNAQASSFLPHYKELFAELDKVIGTDYQKRDYKALKNVIIDFIDDNVWFLDNSIFKVYEMRITDKLVDNFVRRTGDIAKLGKVKGKISGYKQEKIISDLLNYIFICIFRFDTVKGTPSKTDGASLRPAGLKKSFTQA